MNEFNQAKKEYEQTPIPQELGDRVEAGIQQGKFNYRRAKRKPFVRSFGAFAACFGLLVGALNVSPTFASAASQVPVLGGLFQVLTVREYNKVEDGIDYQVSVPGVDAQQDIAQQVNAQIQERVDAHLAKAQQDWEDYKEAFFATGGTQEQWGDRQMDVIVDYEIKSQSDTTVSFVVTLAEGWITATQEQYCYNLNLEDGRDITLADVLGEDWVNICNQSIEAYIDASVDENGFSYFFPAEEGGFTTVDENTSFYLDQDGTPVVVFPEYSIAAGAAGIVEIPIEK